MASPYPQELRDRVLAAYDRGMKTKRIADVLAVSPACTRRIKQRRRETGETTPRPMGGATVLKIDMQRLRELVAAQPDATIRELHERLIEKAPHGHQKTTTLVAALDHRGVRCATTVDGAINGDLFTAFVRQALTPTLTPGEIVVMDNVSSHKVAGVRESIEATGASVAHLPPYSPDYNPIEMVFAKVKQLLRSLACRTRDALWQAMQSLLDQITASDAVGCYRHCGYTLHRD